MIKLRPAPLPTITVKDVLKDFSDIGPQTKDFDFGNPLGYLREDDDDDEEETTVGDADPEDFPDDTVVPKHLSIEGASRIMKLIRAHQKEMHSPSEVGEFKYELRGKDVTFRVKDFMEGVIVTINDPDVSTAKTFKFPLDWQGGKVMDSINTAIAELELGEATNKFTTDDVGFDIRDMATDLIWLGKKGSEIARFLDGDKNFPQMKILLKQANDQANRMMKQIPKILKRM